MLLRIEGGFYFNPVQIMIFTAKPAMIMFVPSCARQGNDGGILWEAFICAEMFIGLSITGKGSVIGKVPTAPKRW